MLARVPLPSHISFVLLVCLTVINGEKATLETPTFAQKRQRTLDMLIRSLYQDLMPDLHKVSTGIHRPLTPTPDPTTSPASVLPLADFLCPLSPTPSSCDCLLYCCCCYSAVFPHCSPAAYCCTTATGYCCNADFLSGAPPRIACCPSAAPSQPSTVAPWHWLYSDSVVAAAAAAAVVLALCLHQHLRPFSLSLFFCLLSLFPFLLYVVQCLGSLFSPEHAKPAVLQRRAAGVSKVGTQERRGAAGWVCQNRAGNKVMNTLFAWVTDTDD